MIFLKMAGNEFKKEWLITINYKFQWFGEFLSLIVFYLYLTKISTKLELYTLSYCLWFYSVLIIGDVSGKLSTEMRLGTFEQMYLSTYSIITLLSIKVLASILRCVFLMIFLFSLLLIFELNYVQIFNKVTSDAFLAALCITPGLFGISLIVGGITILIKDASWLTNILNNSMLFLSGIFLSVDSFPSWIQMLALLLPTTHAIKLINQHSNQFIEWGLTLIFSLIYLVTGGIFFYICDKRARSKGMLGYH